MQHDIPAVGCSQGDWAWRPLMFVSSVATGYGQPPSTVYDWALVPSASSGTSYQLPEEVETRLSIERFCNKVTRSFYTNKMDPMGLVSDEQRGIMSDFLAHDFEEIECNLRPNTSGTPRLFSQREIGRRF